jgi:phosphonate transport system substrate-binding protein
VVKDGSPLRSVLGLATVAGHLQVAATDAPDVERICHILLEPADMKPQEITLTVKRNYVLVAKALLAGQAGAGFFLRAAYESLSEVTRRELRVLISSQIYVVSHSLLASPSLVHLREPIMSGFEAMTVNPTDHDLLGGTGSTSGVATPFVGRRPLHD